MANTSTNRESRRLYIVGAGGHGQVVADSAIASGSWDEIRFIDERREIKPSLFPVAGSLETLLRSDARTGDAVVAIGDAVRRLDVMDTLEKHGFALVTVVHPNATVATSARIERGSVVFAGAIVQPFASVGRGGILNTACSIDHHVTLAEGVHIAPGARLAGNVTVGARSWIGIGAVIRQGVTVGADVVVGAGAAVVADISDRLTVVGVPARPMA